VAPWPVPVVESNRAKRFSKSTWSQVMLSKLRTVVLAAEVAGQGEACDWVVV
jgi:hypothetical protein